MRKSITKPVICMVSLLALIGVKPAFAMEHIRQHVPHAQEVGEARMSVMFWDIYDATLFAPNGKWDGNKPFALHLTYLRHLGGDKIADRSVQEMRAQGFKDEVKLATWHTQMRQIFPDVSEGDAITGIFTKDGQSLFFKNNMEIGRIQDTEFTQHFSAIWLDPKTSAPSVRLGLLGLNTMRGHNDDKTIERTGSYGTTRMH